MPFLMMESAIGKMIAGLFSVEFTFFGATINIGDLSGSIYNMLGLVYTKELDGKDLSGLFKYGTDLYDILLTVALSLLTLFFLMEMFTLFRDVNQITWERTVFKGLKYFGTYALISGLPKLLEAIIAIMNNIYMGYASKININGEMMSLSDSIQQAFNGMDLLQEILGMIIMIFIFSAYVGTAVAAVVSVFSVYIKLIMMYGLAPIPSCMMVFSYTSQAGKRFFQSFAAILFQTTLILILLAIYSQGLASVSNLQGTFESVLGFGIGISVCNALLTGGISIAGSIATEAFGATAF